MPTVEKPMRHIVLVTAAMLALGCGGGQSAKSRGAAEPSTSRRAGPSNEFVLSDSDSAEGAHGASASKIKPTKTEAALKFVVVDKDKGPISGVVVALTAPNGQKYYTEETDAAGYAEVLVPVGQKYDLVYLSLGRKDIAATVPVTDEPNQNIKLTLRYKFHAPPPSVRAAATAADAPAPAEAEPRFVLDGVEFDVGKATLRAESFPRLDSVVEYMTHKKSARIQISGHSDNVGNPKTNKALSEKRAQACRDYLTSKGIEGSRIEAIGYGDERPIAANDSEEGRQQNRRIEATEL
jgi:outer membrane protein OmpA-like peptidoglycan-associated protein